MIEAPNLFILMVLPDTQNCSLCRSSQPCGLMGAIKAEGQSEQALCDRCLYLHCEPLGLALQGIRLMRQAAAYRLGRADEAEHLGDHLVQYSVLLEQSARHSWPRHHPVSKVDCEHCLFAAFPDLTQAESDLLREIFQTYQSLRFRLQTHKDLFVLRHMQFREFPETMKAAAFDRLESFFAKTDEDVLCPYSSTHLYFLNEPVVSVPGKIPFSLPNTDSKAIQGKTSKP